MLNLIAAAVFFVLLHLVVSGTRVRDALTGRMGPGPYMGLFSLASIAGLVWLGFAFADASRGAGNDVIWSISPVTQYLQLALQLLAVSLIVIGLTTPNPTRSEERR